MTTPEDRPAPIDYGQLKLGRDDERLDSFSVTMQAAAKLLGVEANYETIYALSTNGFSPDICPGEPCKSTWRRLGRGGAMDLVGRYLGVTVRPLEFPKSVPLPPPDAQGRKWGTPAYNQWLDNRKKECAAVVHKALDSGAVVVTDGGWLKVDFSLWGIVTAADPQTGRIEGVAPGGKSVMDHVRSYWAVTPGGARLTQAEADREMLRLALLRIRGDREPFAPGALVFGLPAMDLWIKQMQRPAFQEDDPRSSAGNARLCAVYSCQGAKDVAAYLRRRLPAFTEAARPNVQAAVARYERIATLLEPFTVWEKDKGYQTVCGDIAKQKEHADKVLTPVRTELAAAADAIEKALAAEGVKVEPVTASGGGAPVTTNASEKRLAGLTAKSFWMTHMGCLVGCAECLKTKGSPAWVYGGCGHAFALNICEVPCPSGPTAWPAEKCDALAANVGLKVEAFNAYKNAPDFVQAREAVWRKTRAALDAGRPCFGWNMDYPEWFPICGYDADGNYLFLHPNNSVGKRHNTKLGDTDIGVACVLAVSACPPADDRTVVREAARFALEHAAGKHSSGRWRTGLPAYDRWMTWLQDETVYARDGAGFGHAFNAQCWAECRRHAVAFLEEAKKRLPDNDLAPHFEEAIRQYRAVSTSLEAVAKSFPETMGNAKAMDERMRDAGRRAEALKSLTTARDAEVAGLKALARLAVALGANDINPDEVGTPAWITLPAAKPEPSPTTTGAQREVFLKETLDLYRNGKTWNRVPEPEGSAPAGVHSYLTFHFLQMRAAGWKDVDLDDVVVLSGASALYGYQQGSFMPKYAFEYVDYEGWVTRATGFGYEWVPFRDAEGAWRIIKESVDAGKPVKGFAAEGIFFLGYQDADETAGRKVFALAEEPDTFAKWMTWKEFSDWSAQKWLPRRLGRHTMRVGKAATRDTAVRVLSDLVRWAQEPPRAVRQQFPKALFGLKGLETYAANCADMAKYPEWTVCHDMNSQWPTRKSTSAWLKRLADSKTFGANANAHLIAAAKHYDAAVGNWVTACRQVGLTAPEPWQEAGKDPARRRAAASALRLAAEQEAAAVDELRQALAAEGVKVEVPAADSAPGRVEVKREGGKVWIEGVPTLRVEFMSTPLACHAVAMQTAGEDVTYPWLMGVSGHAFRFQLSKGFDPTKDGWCGSSPHANCGYNTEKVAMTALPYEVVDLRCDKNDPVAVAKAREAVVKSIDAGVPAIAVSEESDLIVGYADGGAVLLRRDATGSKVKEWKGTPWWFSVLKRRGAAPDRKQLVRESLVRAVEIASLTESGTDPGDPLKGYDAGLPAMARWAKELRDDATWAKLDEKSTRRVQQFNAWIFNSLVDAREAAAEYLKEIAPQFDEPQRTHVAQAAELYGQVFKALSEQCPTDVAPYPWMKPSLKWDNALRHQQANELDKAAAIERTAIEELKLAAKG